MIPRSAIPKGVRVFTPEETAQRRAVEARLLSVFHRWGFREIITPTFEYLEVFEQPTAEDAGDQIFKFVDRQSGRLLALRVDITPQVARLVATTLRQAPLPLSWRMRRRSSVTTSRGPDVSANSSRSGSS